MESPACRIPSIRSIYPAIAQLTKNRKHQHIYKLSKDHPSIPSLKPLISLIKIDLLLACEDLIPNGIDNIDDTEPVADQDIERWQQLFGFATKEEASNAILEWRGDLGQKTLSPESWAIIKYKSESSGYGKEVYEFYLASQKSYRSATRPGPKLEDTSSDSSYLLKLEGPILDAGTVQAMASLSCTPKVIHGT